MDRFAKALKDPRFRRAPKSVSKVVVDKRFQRMFSDKSFSVEGTVDKYGRKINAKQGTSGLERLYSVEKDQEDDADEEEEQEEEEEDEQEEEEEEEEEKEEEEEEEEEEYDPMRGKGVIDSSDEDDDDVDSDIEQDLTEFERTTLDTIDVPSGEITRRLAVVNMDWDKIRAQDLLQLFDSFKPMGSSILSVKIYPSEFGKERLAHEEQFGPPRSVFSKSSVASETTPSVKSKPKAIKGKQEIEQDEEVSAGIKHTAGDAESQVDPIQLRKYQIERLRYYYAVVECDSAGTASSLYQSCNDLEYETSANVMDLRFIPDEEQFNDPPRDVATVVQANYEPLPFETKALQHTKVDLTWDEDDPARVRLTRRKFTKEDLKSMDFDAYVASSNSDDDSDDDDVDDTSVQTEAPKSLSKEERRAKYRALLAELQPQHEPEQEMEITFTTGLGDVATGLLKKKKNRESVNNKTVWENYLDARKKKRKERRSKTKAESTDSPAEEGSDKEELDTHLDDEESHDGDDDDDDDLFTRKPAAAEGSSQVGKKTKKRAQSAEDERQKAELELLVMDEQNSSAKHYNVRELVKAEKLATKANKKASKKKNGGQLLKDDFHVDVNDPRFSAVFDSHLFAIDPTAPQFKKTKGMKTIVQERQRRIQEKDQDVPDEDQQQQQQQQQQQLKQKQAASSKDANLSKLVESVKRKSAAIVQQPKGKRQKF